MRYWWVNQNQTFRYEIGGGYLWSPKRYTNGARNRFYDNMREVSPGDVVFSFVDTRIRAIGIAKSFCYECPKPIDFGTTGMYWDNVGWRVDVVFSEQKSPVRPKDFIDVLRPHLADRYAPLTRDGNGLQSVYLAEVNESFAVALASLIGSFTLELVRGNTVLEIVADGYSAYPTCDPALLWEDELVRRVDTDPALVETEKSAIILARRGQGAFKTNVQKHEHRCRITQVEKIEHLRASHCRPWRDSNNEQRLDGNNGLLLTPSIDHLFDRGFISFEDNGRLLISPVAHKESLQRMGVETMRSINVGSFSEGQRRHLDFHRSSVYLEAEKR